MLSLEEFQCLFAEDVAQLVRKAGPKVCVFPINGTRRWFILEQGSELRDEYVDAAARRHIELYRMLFGHGLDTLLTPVFGPDLLERGESYMQVAVEGLSRLTAHPDFVKFYAESGVRVRFYGDHRRFLGRTPYAYLSDLFDEITTRTMSHDRYRLFFGVFAHDPTETIAELSVAYYAEHGQIPDKSTLVELYYGEPVGPVDLFIGFDKFCAFDMPLVATGDEDLYFTVSPSLYLTEQQLRTILYDHLYTRRQENHNYVTLESGDWELMRTFYRANLGKTLGVGVKQARGGFWYPLPQVELPEGFIEAISVDRDPLLPDR